MTKPMPMFPLGTVLFPHATLPLHLFEDVARLLQITAQHVQFAEGVKRHQDGAAQTADFTAERQRTFQSLLRARPVAGQDEVAAEVGIACRSVGLVLGPFVKIQSCCYLFFEFYASG